MQPQTAPSLGRIVHFTCDSGTAAKINLLEGQRYSVGDKVAGMITYIDKNNASHLTLFPAADEMLTIPAVPFSSNNQPGTWNWPERVSEAQAA